jgi:hypothetical protein
MNSKSKYNAEFSQLPTSDVEYQEQDAFFDESRDIEEEILNGQLAMAPGAKGDSPLDILIAQVGYGSFQKKLLVCTWRHIPTVAALEY